MSSAESFALALAQCPQVTTLGDRTAGSSGNPRRVEPGVGIVVNLPRWIDMDPQGKPIDAVGVLPRVKVEAKPEDFTGDRDPVLAAALENLRAVRNRRPKRRSCRRAPARCRLWTARRSFPFRRQMGQPTSIRSPRSTSASIGRWTRRARGSSGRDLAANPEMAIGAVSVRAVRRDMWPRTTSSFSRCSSNRACGTAWRFEGQSFRLPGPAAVCCRRQRDDENALPCAQRRPAVLEPVSQHAG